MTTKTVEVEAEEFAESVTPLPLYCYDKLSGDYEAVEYAVKKLIKHTYLVAFAACEQKLAASDGARAFSEFNLSSHVLRSEQTIAFGEGAPRESLRVEQLIKIMAWIKQQQSSMKHLLENYIDPNSTAGEQIKLSLERLEKILGEK